jgi:hypothetical protein
MKRSKKQLINISICRTTTTRTINMINISLIVVFARFEFISTIHSIATIHLIVFVKISDFSKNVSYTKNLNVDQSIILKLSAITSKNALRIAISLTKRVQSMNVVWINISSNTKISTRKTISSLSILKNWFLRSRTHRLMLSWSSSTNIWTRSMNINRNAFSFRSNHYTTRNQSSMHSLTRLSNIVKNDNQIDLIIYLINIDDWEYWFKEKRKKIYHTQKAFAKNSRYFFFDQINFRLLINLITVKEDQNSDIISFLKMRSSSAFYNLVLIRDFELKL